MKKPNKLYRKLGGRRSRAGQAFAAARHPVTALRDAFGRDLVARDAAESFSMVACKRGFQLVMATLSSWGLNYRGPKLSWLFRNLNGHVPRVGVDHHKPELD
jgi:hypothetical protein